MKSSLARIVLGAALALSPGMIYPQPAAAQDLELEIGREGPRLRLRDGECDPRFERCRDRDEEFGEEGFRDRRAMRERERFCTEDRALDKAERMGIRRARIVAAGRRTIQVRGRDRFGERVGVTFGRDRRCPVLD